MQLATNSHMITAAIARSCRRSASTNRRLQDDRRLPRPWRMVMRAVPAQSAKFRLAPIEQGARRPYLFRP